MLPTPHEIFASFEKGEIEREELQSLMAVHARELIQEMEEDYQNPAAALIESLLARRAAAKLIKKHGEKMLREVLIGISEIRGFPPARYLWNASHPDLPLYCFLRMRRQPVLRLVAVEVEGMQVRAVVEHGSAKKSEIQKDELLFTRDGDWKLVALRRP